MAHQRVALLAVILFGTCYCMMRDADRFYITWNEYYQELFAMEEQATPSQAITIPSTDVPHTGLAGVIETKPDKKMKELKFATAPAVVSLGNEGDDGHLHGCTATVIGRFGFSAVVGTTWKCATGVNHFAMLNGGAVAPVRVKAVEMFPQPEEPVLYKLGVGLVDLDPQTISAMQPASTPNPAVREISSNIVHVATWTSQGLATTEATIVPLNECVGHGATNKEAPHQGLLNNPALCLKIEGHPPPFSSGDPCYGPAGSGYIVHGFYSGPASTANRYIFVNLHHYAQGVQNLMPRIHHEGWAKI